MKAVKDFVEKYRKTTKPLLLAYSGGPDSKALLYSLLEAGCATVEIAHFDHGWREESEQESLLLEQEAALLKLPFHRERGVLEGMENREERARDARFAFFSRLWKGKPYEALLLGHQANDLAETVLKRILEGAHLPFLGGMREVSQMGEMTLWRPFLQTPREKILSFLEKRSLTPLFDPTNGDPHYLRARMRLEMVPFLELSLGKKIGANLALLSHRAEEWKEYLDRKIASRQLRKEGDLWAVFAEGWDRIEARHLIQSVAREKGLSLSRPLLESLLDWVEQKKGGNRAFIQNHWVLYLQGWVLFYPVDGRNSLPEKEKICRIVSH